MQILVLIIELLGSTSWHILLSFAEPILDLVSVW